MALVRSHAGRLPLAYACESGDDATLDFLRELRQQLVRNEQQAAEAAEDAAAEAAHALDRCTRSHEEMVSLLITSFPQLSRVSAEAQVRALAEERNGEERVAQAEAARLVEAAAMVATVPAAALVVVWAAAMAAAL